MHDLLLLKIEFVSFHLLLVLATAVMVEKEAGEDFSLVLAHLFYESRRLVLRFWLDCFEV